MCKQKIWLCCLISCCVLQTIFIHNIGMYGGSAMVMQIQTVWCLDKSAHMLRSIDFQGVGSLVQVFLCINGNTLNKIKIFFTEKQKQQNHGAMHFFFRCSRLTAHTRFSQAHLFKQQSFTNLCEYDLIDSQTK